MFSFDCQSEAIGQLQELAAAKSHSILLCGQHGCGKTYLAKYYANLLSIIDFQVVLSTVGDLQTMMDTTYALNTPVVICVENLDDGVAGAAYTLLKFLEEPCDLIYVVVTCTNIRQIPETIASRCAVVNVNEPRSSDILKFANSIDESAARHILPRRLWSCIRSFSDVNQILKLTPDQLTYFASLPEIFDTRKPISQLMWDLGHYPDNSPAPIELVMRYLLAINHKPDIRDIILSCLVDLDNANIAKHVVLASMCMQIKYR